METLDQVNSRIVVCEHCPRLRAWCALIAMEKRRAFEEWTYWGLPVPNFGDPAATRLIVGLAPAAHGANRTGRMFTGDRSGEWLFRALYKAGAANQAESSSKDDGLRLRGVLITAIVHCAPPDNKPTPTEIAFCRTHLTATLCLSSWDSILCLGSLAWHHTLKALGERPCQFGHGASIRTTEGIEVLASYHPSQQNTFTGKLTEEMLDEVTRRFLSAVRSPESREQPPSA